jgi:hypothetical protein
MNELTNERLEELKAIVMTGGTWRDGDGNVRKLSDNEWDKFYQDIIALLEAEQGRIVPEDVQRDIDAIRNNWPDERYSMLREALSHAIAALQAYQPARGITNEEWNKRAEQERIVPEDVQSAIDWTKGHTLAFAGGCTCSGCVELTKNGNTIIAALKQMKPQEPCFMCNGEEHALECVRGRIGEEVNVIATKTGGYLSVQLEYDNTLYPISHCPACGRKLGGEQT